MNKLLLVAFVALLLVPAGPALAQGMLVLYTDATYTSCNAVTLGAGFVYVHVVHEYAPAKASRFALRNTNVPGLVWILDQFPAGSPNSAPGGGNTQVGWAVGYGDCRQAGHPVCIAWYQDTTGTPGTPGQCGLIEVVADPADVTGQVTGSDCNDQLTFPEGSRMTVNGDGTCPCGGDA